MDELLIIKLGALGDVIRTTPLLRVLKGRITWVTRKSAVPLLRNNKRIHEIIDIGSALQHLQNRNYRLVVSLDEEPAAGRLASVVKKSELIGTYENDKGIVYTDSSRAWFDMSLISRYDRLTADKKKQANRRSYQEILFGMLGRKFRGEEYILPKPFANNRASFKPLSKGLVGIEARSGERWIAKRWPRIIEFISLLESKKIRFVQFRQFPSLSEFIHFIDKTDFVVTTDSLALHIALGLRKKVVGLFTCTSPYEIHDYGRMVKAVSPLLNRFYYSTECSQESGEQISPQSILKALLKLEEKGN